jgi:signal peptide peptidase SppA
MKFLSKALSGRSPLLIDPIEAKSHSDRVSMYALSDLLSQIFGETPKPYKLGKYGIIPIVGVIGKGLSPLEKMTGATDLNDISKQIDVFMKDPEVKEIVFHIDSPGGTVTGVEEVTRKIKNSSKPTISYTDGMMASAAYWMGSAADRVVGSPSSDVGSVGVYMVVQDVSELYAASGVKMIVIKSSSSPLKAAGLEGTSLSQEQIDNFQVGVDEIYNNFVASVKQKRKLVSEDSLKGQIMSGTTASKKGLLTGLADSLDEILK